MTGLRIPPLSLTDGSPDPIWTDVPLGSWRFSRIAPLRLPYDQRSATSLRRFLRLKPWSLPASLIAVSAWLALVRTDFSPILENILLVVAWSNLLWGVLERRGLPEQQPSRSRDVICASRRFRSRSPTRGPA